MKVVGVGSVGLGAFVLLLDGGVGDDPLFLQAKQAEASVYERFLGPSPQPSHGARVVAGQRRLQAASDVLLGWTVGDAGPPLVRPPAPGPEGQRGRRGDDRRGPRDVGRAVRLGPRPRPRAVRRAGDDRRLPRRRRRPSTTRWARSPRPTPTRPSVTSRPSRRRSPRAGSSPRAASRAGDRGERGRGRAGIRLADASGRGGFLGHGHVGDGRTRAPRSYPSGTGGY